MGRTASCAIKLLLAALLTVALTGSSAWAAKPIRLATIVPEGSTWMKQMRIGAERIKQRTEGRVKIKFYTGGVMGNDRSVLRKIRVGQLDGGAFTSGSLSEVYNDLRIYSVPFLFPSHEAVDYVRERVDPVLRAGLEKAGFICFGFAEGGFARFFAREPVMGMASLKGKKMWVPEGDPISKTVIDILSLSPVSLPITDVLTGLQTGLLDIVATPPIGAIAFQWYTKVKYITETPLAYTMATLVISAKRFKKLSAEDQQIMREEMSAIYRGLGAKNRDDNKEAYRALLDEGLESVTPHAADLEIWRTSSDKAAQKLIADGQISRETYDLVHDHLAQFKADRGK